MNKKSEKKPEKKKWLRVFHLKDRGEIVGGIGLQYVDKKNQNAEIGYWLGKKYWGQSLTKESLRLVLDYGFKKTENEKNLC